MGLTEQLEEEAEMTCGEIVRQEVPELPEGFEERVLWNYTGFPHFWRTDDPEESLRQDLREFRERWLREGEFWDPLEGVKMPERE